MKIPSDISLDCPGSKSGMSAEVTRRDVSDRLYEPCRPGDPQINEKNE